MTFESHVAGTRYFKIMITIENRVITDNSTFLLWLLVDNCCQPLLWFVADQIY